jgi:hypothetical protein
MTDVVDWNAELRRIEREFDGLPPEPSPAQVKAQRAAERRAEERRRERAAKRGVFVRAALVAALAAAIGFWPYHRDCGVGLFAYMGAEGMVVAGGLWLMVCTWRQRMARTHAVGLIMMLWGLMLVAHQALPRVGYATSDPAKPSRWVCAASP